MLVKNVRSIQRERRHLRIRAKVSGTLERPRLTVFRSHKHLYAQLVNDFQGKTLLSLSTLSKPMKEKIQYGGNIKAAEILGQMLAEEAKKLKIESVVFDRGGYQYHGRVRVLAEAARRGGLAF